ncbi:hypothetical protein [Burkholderia sp. YIM B11467]
MHSEEKKAIAEKAGKDKAEEEKLTRAACYAVTCWAEYPEESDERNRSFVSEAEIASSQPELHWVIKQKEAGLFEYMPMQKVGNALENDSVGIFNGFSEIISSYASSKWPMCVPVINEVTNKVNEGGVAKSI